VKKVQSIQKFACKIITKSRKYDHVTPLLRELNWLPVDKLLHYTDPNLAWHHWKAIFLQIADKHASLRLRKVKSEYTPWLIKEIKNMSYHRDFLKRKQEVLILQRTMKHIKNVEMK
jgi:hypothetical protein